MRNIFKKQDRSNIKRKPILTKKSPSFLPTKTGVLLVLLSFFIGVLLTNRIDNYIAHHVFTFRSPITFQSPVLIEDAPLVSAQVIRELVKENAIVNLATPTASPSANPTVNPSSSPPTTPIAKKGSNLR